MVWVRLLAKVLFLVLVFGLIATATAWFVVERQSAERIYASAADVPPAKAALVLGTSRWMPGRMPNPYFDYRIDTAARLFEAGKVDYVIVSGNQSQGGRPNGGYDEPNDMRDALVAEGVPADRIYRDYAGFRTLDLVLRANSVFGQERVIVVSQRFHLARALYLASQYGLSFDGLEAEDAPLRYGWRTQLREAGARLKAVIDSAFGIGPRFGGAKIALGVDPPS